VRAKEGSVVTPSAWRLKSAMSAARPASSAGKKLGSHPRNGTEAPLCNSEDEKLQSLRLRQVDVCPLGLIVEKSYTISEQISR